MKFSVLTVSVLLGGLLFVSGCPTNEAESRLFLQRITPVPIAMTAEVEYPNEDVPGFPTIRLSESGVVGLGCTEYCAEGLEGRRSCAQTTATIEPAGIAEVRDVFLLNGAEGARVLIAKQPGTATLTVTSPCVSASYRVVIEPSF